MTTTLYKSKVTGKVLMLPTCVRLDGQTEGLTDSRKQVSDKDIRQYGPRSFDLEARNKFKFTNILAETVLCLFHS